MARIGADNIESFSPYQQRDVTQVRVHDSGDLELTFETPLTPFELIGRRTRETSAAGKKPLAIGGEHTITPVIVAELARVFPNLCVLQFDAHSDLRPEFLGERLCHATAMHRVLDCVPRDRLFQVGIRSFSKAEEMTMPNLYPFDVLGPIAGIAKAVGTRPLYVTLDTDVLDPGVLPEVQTPQPGGCSYFELVRSLARLAGLDVVGCDIVEFRPAGFQPSAGASIVAELVRELILLLARP